jgi:hypothetical protein
MPQQPPEGARRPPEIPGRLEEMIEVAFHNNPDVRVAEARLREAEAELSRVRQQVVRELTEISPQRARLLAEREETQAALAESEKTQAAVDRLAPIPVPSPQYSEEQYKQNLRRHLREVIEALEPLDVRVRYLLGITPGFGPQGPWPGPAGRLMDERRPEPGMNPRPPIPERYKEILEKRSDFIYVSGTLRDMLARIVDMGIPLVYPRMAGVNLDVDCKPNLDLKNAPVADILTALAEVTGSEICFVFRDYGVLVTSTREARMIPGAVIPPYVPFLGQGPEPGPPNPPQEPPHPKPE